MTPVTHSCPLKPTVAFSFAFESLFKPYRGNTISYFTTENDSCIISVLSSSFQASQNNLWSLGRNHCLSYGEDNIDKLFNKEKNIWGKLD